MPRGASSRKPNPDREMVVEEPDWEEQTFLFDGCYFIEHGFINWSTKDQMVTDADAPKYVIDEHGNYWETVDRHPSEYIYF